MTGDSKSSVDEKSSQKHFRPQNMKFWKMSQFMKKIF